MLAVTLLWQASFSYSFRRAAPINILEAETQLSLTKRLARSGLRHRRILVLRDSSVLVGAASKGGPAPQPRVASLGFVGARE